ncbi:hypothetical protein Vadar_033678 [Vaccinium darrowii]|uniref:Uncharacterized protein n=1 Tax=Vaccinium darrowii TaxID=229202 RepID=A0ACB7X6Q6_9ERIC|nr:hypothetical protein Vadar_033678 [Vaccinium darrowii]
MKVIKDAFVSFYSGLLGKPHSTPYAGYDRINQLITKRLTTVQSVHMVQDVSNTEIKDMFMGLNPHKAPGLDGYNARFFQKAWHIVGHEVIAAIRNFFKSGKLLSRANATIVALVPKVPNPSRVGDYRPISCCNVIYKCIAKILARRIQSVLPELIDPVQSGFVKGRRIADNIFLTQEIMHGWEFLWDTLTCMNFHPKMITWIKACVTTANYALNINGDPTGNFKGARGLRQGDPLSSYLFVIVMEVLTCILKEKSNEPDFKFHWRCNQPKIINLCFADDLMLFCKGDVNSVKHIQNSLSEFESLSGLSPSPGKSSIFFSGVQHSTRIEILQLLDFKEGTLPVRYLGVPLLSSKLRYMDCKPMIDKITSRTKTWTNRDLTYAGRIQLIKNVLFSMQTYWSSLFILPKKVIKEVEATLRSFLWFGPDLKKTGAKVSWEHLCCPKQEGGLGFKSIVVWNKAAIAKHIWFLISGGEQSMWCQWVKSYLLKGRNFWEVKMPSSPSWVWRKLLNLRPLVQSHIKVIIGNGRSTSLWYDNWHPLGPLALKFGHRVIYDSGLTKVATVSAIIRNSRWCLPITQTLELNELRDAMSSAPSPNHELEDHHKWLLNSNGEFTISSLWDDIRVQYPKVPWHSSICIGPDWKVSRVKKGDIQGHAEPVLLPVLIEFILLQLLPFFSRLVVADYSIAVIATAMCGVSVNEDCCDCYASRGMPVFKGDAVQISRNPVSLLHQCCCSKFSGILTVHSDLMLPEFSRISSSLIVICFSPLARWAIFAIRAIPSKTLVMEEPATSMEELGSKPEENLAKGEDTITDPYDLGSKAVDSYVVCRKQMGSTHSKNNNNAATSGNPIGSKLLIPGTVYSTPTKFTPFKPLDLDPPHQKSFDRKENLTIFNEDGTQRSLSDPKTPEPSKSFGPQSPTKSSPNSAQKLRDVFQQAGEHHLEGEGKVLALVQALEEVMQTSGNRVDCSELRTQLIQLHSKEITSEGSSPSTSQGGGGEVLEALSKEMNNASTGASFVMQPDKERVEIDDLAEDTHSESTKDHGTLVPTTGSSCSDSSLQP